VTRKADIRYMQESTYGCVPSTRINMTASWNFGKGDLVFLDDIKQLKKEDDKMRIRFDCPVNTGNESGKLSMGAEFSAEEWEHIVDTNEFTLMDVSFSIKAIGVLALGAPNVLPVTCDKSELKFSEVRQILRRFDNASYVPDGEE